MFYFFKFLNFVFALFLSDCLAQNFPINDYSNPPISNQNGLNSNSYGNNQYGNQNSNYGIRNQSSRNNQYETPFNPYYNNQYGNQPLQPNGFPYYNQNGMYNQPYNHPFMPNFYPQHNYPPIFYANQNRPPMFNLYQQEGSSKETDYAENKKNPYEGKSIYNLKVRKLNGKLDSLSEYQDKCLLIVNTASSSIAAQANMLWLNEIFNKKNLYLNHTENDFTKEEEERNKLLKDNLFIIAVPSNSFGEEPLKGDDLLNWFKSMNANYEILELTDLHHSELYAILADHAHLSVYNNFNKYLVWKNATHVELFSSTSGPEEVGSRVKNDKQTLTGKIEDCIAQRLSPKIEFISVANENLEAKKIKRNFQFSSQMKRLFEQNKIDLSKLNLTDLESQRFKRDLIIENYDKITDDQYDDGSYLDGLNQVRKLHLNEKRSSKRFVNEFKKETKKSSNRVSRLRTPTEMEELEGEELDPVDQVDQPKRRTSRRSAPKRKKSGRRKHRYH